MKITSFLPAPEEAAGAAEGVAIRGIAGRAASLAAEEGAVDAGSGGFAVDSSLAVAAGLGAAVWGCITGVVGFCSILSSA